MTANPAYSPAPANDYSLLAPRFWHGMRAAVWWRMVARNRFRIAANRAHIALGVSLVCPINDLLASLQRMIYEARIQATPLTRDPVFILGHWRSGTTLLHELLVTDDQFASPTTYQCFAPSHFLASPFVPRFGGFLLPAKRPMDNMDAGWMLPQEDEFALMNLGVPSPYLRIAFPQTQALHLEYLNMSGLSESAVQFWQERLLWFLKAVTLANQGRQLVLKSPPHTGRLRLLRQMFPNAKFIHLIRDPRQLFPSTMRLWNSLDQLQALQPGYSEAEMKQYVARCLQLMYDGYHAARGQVPDRQIIDVRYEQLVASPLHTLRLIYEQLELGDFDQVAGRMEALLATRQDYRTNRHRSDPQWEAEVLSYCDDYARRYGYAAH